MKFLHLCLLTLLLSSAYLFFWNLVASGILPIFVETTESYVQNPLNSTSTSDGGILEYASIGAYAEAMVLPRYGFIPVYDPYIGSLYPIHTAFMWFIFAVNLVLFCLSRRKTLLRNEDTVGAWIIVGIMFFVTTTIKLLPIPFGFTYILVDAANILQLYCYGVAGVLTSLFLHRIFFRSCSW